MSRPGGGPGTAGEQDLLAALRRMWQRHDPVPDGLATRICFALEMERLEAELAQVHEQFGLVGARGGQEQARTITFTSASLTVMVTIGEPSRGLTRLDGWIGDGGSVLVTLRQGLQEQHVRADGDGRFAFEAVPCGLTQFVFTTGDGSGRQLARPVVTPEVRL